MKSSPHERPPGLHLRARPPTLWLGIARRVDCRTRPPGRLRRSVRGIARYRHGARSPCHRVLLADAHRHATCVQGHRKGSRAESRRAHLLLWALRPIERILPAKPGSRNHSGRRVRAWADLMDRAPPIDRTNPAERGPDFARPAAIPRSYALGA